MDTSQTKRTILLLKWGMQVAEYRERCRHLISRRMLLPDKQQQQQQQPVLAVAVTSTRTTDNSTTTPRATDELVVVDKNTCDIMTCAWDLARRLLASISAVLLLLLQQQNNMTDNTITTTLHSTSNLETEICHVDHVITGQAVRSLDEIAASASIVKKKKHSRSNFAANSKTTPPPIDLLDAILAELQSQNSKDTNATNVVEPQPLGGKSCNTN
jgi:hypothetical protein